ncbi:MAG: SUMF1/EgtB/PvdO family nonheme iron enzyme [Myxococcales bacterium]|nr:SUMF1/EgtB/PvdO family nonheme iron enzyme [Myxococcales bacterium]
MLFGSGCISSDISYFSDPGARPPGDETDLGQPDLGAGGEPLSEHDASQASDAGRSESDDRGAEAGGPDAENDGATPGDAGIDAAAGQEPDLHDDSGGVAESDANTVTFEDALDDSVDESAGEPDLRESPMCQEDGVQPNPNLGLTELVLSAECPAGMLFVAADDPYCVDAYEAFIEGWSPFQTPESTIGPARSVYGGTPQGYISGNQAEDACEAAGKRLCTNTEWLAACRGEDDYVYPYGQDRVPGACNDARARHPLVELYNTGASWIWSKMDNPCINQQASTLATSGAHDECVSPVGAYDMMGNLHEWTSDSSGVMRGGFYVDTEINGNGCLYRTTAHSRGYSDYSTGFRCCSDPL